jgi:pimeloyl-ACP methyl ester carboxylesterase
MGAFARRLERQGFTVLRFNYRTTRTPLKRSARRLRHLLTRQAPDGAHLIGHSLGGLLLLHLLVREQWRAPGRLLFLGTPLQGSAVARVAGSWPAADKLFGHAEGPLERGHRSAGDGWPPARDSGMIAGDRALGLGLLTGALAPPHDGTVAVAETRHPDLTDHIVLPVTHTGMIYSRQVARQAGKFLTEGHFDHGARGDRRERHGTGPHY